MFGSEALEVGVGVTLMLLFVSLICTAAREALEIRLRTRAADLEQGIRELLRDHEGTGLTSQLYAHPLIYSLFLGNYDPNNLEERGDARKYMARNARANLPSYIPAGNFAAAILDIVARWPVPKEPGAEAEPKPADTAPLSTASLRATVERIEGNDYLKQAILSALDGTKDDIGAVKANLEMWFNGTMDRVSGWYKRRTQKILFIIGLFAAVTLNVDIITVAERLTRDKPLREAVVSQAKAIGAARDKVDAKDLEALQQRTFEDLTRQMVSIGYPIGWTRDAQSLIPWPTPQACSQAPRKPVRDKAPTEAGSLSSTKVASDTKSQTIAVSTLDKEAPPDCRMSGPQWMMAAFGWLITAFAVMLGAPFWFDVLNKFMVIRSTVKPREKSQEEGSEDRAQTTAARVLQQLAKTGGVQTGRA